MNNIEKTKKELNIYFTVIVFFIMSFFWTTFFLVKYVKDVSIEKIYVEEILNIAEKWNITLDNIIRFQNRFNYDFKKKRNNKDEILINPMNNLIKTKGFINYLHYDSSDKLIWSNIKDEIKINLIDQIKASERYFGSEIIWWFLVRKFIVNNDNWTFIILKKLRYSNTDLLSDILWFILINILFSLILYFVWTRFINKVFVPVEENILDMKNFIHNAWHELKTPIAVIDSNIQIIDEMKSYDKDMTKELKKEALKINSIIESLIKLSDIDSFKEIDKNKLKNTIDEILVEQEKQIKKKNIKIELDIGDDIIVKANKSYLYIVLSNLIWNAIKYNKNSWGISIKYKSGQLIIEDTWIWIKKDEIEKIFDRFYKIDKSRNTEWFWIGLSLVKKIANVYNWEIKVKSKVWEKTSFGIKF